MIPHFGSFFLSCALAMLALQLIGIAFKKFTVTANFASKFSGGLIIVSYFTLTYLYIISDFRVSNIFENSHTAKPLIYKISGVWGNHEGSILLFLVMIVLFNFLFSYFSKYKFKDLVLNFQNFILLLLLGYIYFVSNPFDMLPPMTDGSYPTQGQGLNPLLQDIGLAIHPPLLYLGYTGLSLCLSFAMAGLLSGKVDKDFAKKFRPWILLPWSFLTFGIAVGSWWAYRELGWGGFWFWDAVENSSLIPWLAATALLHSNLVLEKREKLKLWTIFLAIISFVFCMVGFFLVRSGILSSVHSFSSDPTRGIFLLIITSLISVVALYVFTSKLSKFKESGEVKLVSKESGLILNNLFMCTMCFTILLGTIYPILSEVLADVRVSVGGPYFNYTFIPVAILSIIFTTIIPQIKWQKDKINHRHINLAVTLLMSVIIAILIYRKHSDDISYLAFVSLIVCFWVVIVNCYQLVKIIFSKTKLTTAIMAMFLAHSGIGILGLGISLNMSLKKEVQAVMNNKLSEDNYEKLGEYMVGFKGAENYIGENFIALKGNFDVISESGELYKISAENRFYLPDAGRTTEAGVKYLFEKDIYIALGEGERKDSGIDEYAVRMYLEPFILLIWVGAAMIGISGFLAIRKTQKS
jgi:cytochrome c-type biogenesis protein CcmF